jgi:hypothetical protein
VDYDFAIVQVIDQQHPEQLPSTIHPNYFPTTGIRIGTPVMFKVRTFRTTAAQETWDFGDGSPRVTVQSDGNAVKHAPDGYAVTTHRFRKAGHHVIRVEHTNQHGLLAIGHLHVEVAE